MLHSLRIYLSIPEVFFIFFEEAVVAVVNMQLASKFHLHKAQVFEVWSFNVIFSQSRKRTNFPPTVQTTFDQRSKYNWPTRAFAKRKLEKGANSKRPLHPHLARLQSQELLKIDIWRKKKQVLYHSQVVQYNAIPREVYIKMFREWLKSKSLPTSSKKLISTSPFAQSRVNLLELQGN